MSRRRNEKRTRQATESWRERISWESEIGMNDKKVKDENKEVVMYGKVEKWVKGGKMEEGLEVRKDGKQEKRAAGWKQR